jgi:hypothetical protein
MEKTIINYASGGLGNILLPLCSSKVISKKTGRKLIACWEPTFACMATFKDLIDEDVEVITKNDLLLLSDVKIYAPYLSAIHADGDLFKNTSLTQLSNKFLTLPVDHLNLNDVEENIIVYHNNIFPTLDTKEVIEEFRNLKWNSKLTSQINELSKELNIDKSVCGVHARATDFNEGIGVYADVINTIIRTNPDARIFLCSDSEEWEVQLCAMFPKNVFIRKKKASVVKNNENLGTWSNNIFRSEDSVMEAVIDIHLLSKTNFTIYNGHSSFAQMIKHLM